MISNGHHTQELPTPRSQPFLKWPGGKRWLWNVLQGLLPKRFNHYFEPFLGGGAIFFALNPKRAFLSDINGELINAYIQVRDEPDKIIKGLRTLSIDQKTYDGLRNADLRNGVEKAVRFIYLSKAAFNGMYRVNRQGMFNVPFGKQTGRKIFDPEELLRASQQLRGCKIINRDFGKSLATAGFGDFVYCDPPYTVHHNNNGFLRYNENLFSWADQERLAKLATQAAGRGATVVVSNAHTSHLRKLYASFLALSVSRTSCISALASSRGEVVEYLFISRPKNNNG